MKFWPFGKKNKTSRSRRSYAAATDSRLLADFITGATSADTEIYSSLVKLRNRSRELARNNDYVKSALRVIRNNIVGQGIPFQAQVKKQRGDKLDTVKNQQIESCWYEWTRAQSCDVSGRFSFTDIESLAITSTAKNGEIFIRLHREKFGSSKVPLALEVLAADLLDERYNVQARDTGNEIRMGVERDIWKRPVAYWFHAKHPGDWVTVPGVLSIGRRIRVPAKDVIHLFVPEDEDQTRAVPWFHTAITRLHHMQGYEEAEIVAARASASLMGFIETPEGQLQGDDIEDGQRVTEFEPGVFKQLNPGEKMNVPALSRPGGQFDPFMRAMLRGVAAGSGLSYESLSRDYSQTNYSSARQALLEDRDNWRSVQQWMIRNFHQRVLEEWLDMAYLAGELSLPLYATNPELYREVKWMPRGWGWVDPLKEVEAYKAAVRSGFTTLSEVIAQSGGDFDETMTVRAREIQRCKDLGIILDTDPGIVPKPGVNPATLGSGNADQAPADQQQSSTDQQQ